MGVLEIFNLCPVDIWLVCWSYLVGALEIFVDFLEIFDRCPGDI